MFRAQPRSYDSLPVLTYLYTSSTFNLDNDTTFYWQIFVKIDENWEHIEKHLKTSMTSKSKSLLSILPHVKIVLLSDPWCLGL